MPADALPLPEKRKGFTPRQVAAVFIKCEARCAKCREKVRLGEYAIDHIQRLDALGKHELDNWQLLCLSCHKPKTKVDNWEAKKGARVRRETGQQAKRDARGPTFKSRNDFAARRSDEGTEAARPREAICEKQIKSQIKPRSQIQSRPFDKTKTRTFAGKVRERVK